MIRWSQQGDNDARKHWRLLDSSENVLAGEVLVPFAAEEIECAAVGAGSPPLLHIWRHQRALVLGLRDRKLPQASSAAQKLAADGWEVAVRHSGGAAVPLDKGVVNVSLVLPNTPGAVHFHDDFAFMASVIGATVRQLDAETAVQTGEIAGAYCPGDYDLAIDGRKFCGIAQRRRVGGYVLQAFVVVEGEGARLANIAADYYRSAGAPSSEQPALLVETNRTASLQELVGSSITVKRFVEALQNVVLTGAHIADKQTGYEQFNQSELERTIQTMKQRYGINPL